MVGLFWRWHLSKYLKERRELADHNYILRKSNSGQRKQRLWDRSVSGVWKTNNKPYPGPISQIMNFNYILWLLICTLTFEKPQQKSLLLWCAKSLQSCPTLCNTMGCNPPVSSVHRIFQARMLERVANPPSEDLPDPGIKLVFLMSLALAVGFLITNATWKAPL